jgi:hypothetical protein
MEAPNWQLCVGEPAAAGERIHSWRPAFYQASDGVGRSPSVITSVSLSTSFRVDVCLPSECKQMVLSDPLIRGCGQLYCTRRLATISCERESSEARPTPSFRSGQV